jgi:hypothetical protein
MLFYVVVGVIVVKGKTPDVVADRIIYIVHQETFLYVNDLIKNAGNVKT